MQASQASHPVVYLHSKSGCPHCHEALQPKNFQSFTADLRSINANVEIRIINHTDWTITNQEDEYPRFKIFTWAPMVSVTSSSNANKTGDPSKVKYFGGYYDPGKSACIKLDNFNMDFKEWFKQSLAQIDWNQAPMAPIPPVKPADVNINTVQQLVSSVQAPAPTYSQNKQVQPERKCQGFRMISLNGK